MNLKNLKSIDYKGLAIRHCEKAAIAIAACLLVLFLFSGVNKALSSGKTRPDEINRLAQAVKDSVKKSQFDDGVAKTEGLVNPNFRDMIEQLKSEVDTEHFRWVQNFFHFVDFGNILRQQPEILKPHSALVYRDRGAVYMYETDERGEVIMVEPRKSGRVRRATTTDDDSKKKKTTAAATPKPKGPSGGMMGAAMRGRMGGYGSGMGGYGSGSGGMGQTMIGEMPGSEGMAEAAGGGQSADAQNPTEGMASAAAGSGRIKQSMARRGASSTRREFDRFTPGEQEPETESKAADAPADRSSARSRLIPKETVRGLRWVVITALFPHAEQVKKFQQALHADEVPEYWSVKVERRVLQSDGSFSEWMAIDDVRQKKLVSLLPERWEPENPDFVAAHAIFERLVMPLPQLAAGEWNYVDRPEAFQAAIKALPSGLASTSRGRAGMDGEGGGQGDASADASSLFERDRDKAKKEKEKSKRGPGGMPMGPVAATGAGSYGASGAGGYGKNMPKGAVASTSTYSGAGGGAYTAGMDDVEEDVQMQQPAGSGRGLLGGMKIHRTNAETVQIRYLDYTVEPEHTYQYRLKVLVKNPNAGRPDVADEQAALAAEIESAEWSDPTPVVFVPPDKEYYVVERSKGREEARLQVHTWVAKLGDWQYAEFPVKPGDPIGREVSDHWFVDFSMEKHKDRVDFATHDLLVDISGGNKTFTVDNTQYTEPIPAEVLIVDQLGELANRNEEVDKYDLTRRERVDYIKQLLSQAVKKEDKKSGDTPEVGTKDDFEGRVPKRRGEGGGQ